MLVVFQLMTKLMRTKREMQLNSVNPNCVSAPPFCVVRLVRLLVNWYSQSTPELALGNACASKIAEFMSQSPVPLQGMYFCQVLPSFAAAELCFFLSFSTCCRNCSYSRWRSKAAFAASC